MTSLLKDKVFISTRPIHDSDDLPSLLSDEGAKVLEFPLIQIEEAEISDVEKNMIANTALFDWIIFTSVNGVRFFFKKLKAITGNHHLDDSVKLAVIGAKTEQVLLSYGYNASFINPGSTAEDFSIPFLHHIMQDREGQRILLPVGNLARTVMQDNLGRSTQCERINIYKTELPKQINKEITETVSADNYDMMIFTSPSGIRNFVAVMPDLPKEAVRMACIGDITYNEAIKNGYKPLVTAMKSSTAGLVESIINYYISKK